MNNSTLKEDYLLKSILRQVDFQVRYRIISPNSQDLQITSKTIITCPWFHYTSIPHADIKVTAQTSQTMISLALSNGLTHHPPNLTKSHYPHTKSQAPSLEQADCPTSSSRKDPTPDTIRNFITMRYQSLGPLSLIPDEYNYSLSIFTTSTPQYV